LYGFTLIPRHGGRSLVWDVTDRTTTAGTVADRPMAATRKLEKYSTLSSTPGSAPGPTFGNEYGKTLPFYLQHTGSSL